MEQIKSVYAASVDGRAFNARYIQKELRRLYDNLTASKAEIIEAINADTGNSSSEVEAEYCLTLSAVRNEFISIDNNKALEEEYRIANQHNNEDRLFPIGCIYLVPSTVNSFYSTIVPLAMAISTGNCVILELKQTLSELNALLRQLLSKTLDGDTFVAIDSKPDKLDILSKPNLKVYDMTAASPSRVIAVVDRTANIGDAAREITRARFSFRGRSPYAPDLVLVNEFVMKDFCNAVIQNASSLIADHVNGLTNGSAHKPRSKEQSVLSKYSSEEGNFSLLSTTRGKVIIARERSSDLLSQKIAEPLLVLHAITSLDDAIDLANSGSEQPALALYNFCTPATAKYLGQFINTRLSCTNKIPAELLVGPAPHESVTPSIESRFARSMFQVPRPEYISFMPLSTGIATLLDEGQNDQWKALVSKSLAPLPPSDQPQGEAVGFFEQGIFTGFSTLLATTIASALIVGIYGIPAVVRRLR